MQGRRVKLVQIFVTSALICSIQPISELTYQQKITTKRNNIGHETLVHIRNRHDLAFFLLATTKQL